jgi:futalosine hydrolase
MARADILVIAATRPELGGGLGLVCGVGPVEAAANTARALAVSSPAAVLHVGLAGARGGCGIEIGSLVVGEDACYEDLATATPLAPSVSAADPRLVRAAGHVLGVVPVRIGTSARLGGIRECPVEAMEGFAVLRACELAGVPAVEVRAISNRIGDARADWRLDEAGAALESALPRLLDAVAAALVPER